MTAELYESRVEAGPGWWSGIKGLNPGTAAFLDIEDRSDLMLINTPLAIPAL